MEGGGQFQDTRVKCTSWKPESSQVTQPFVNEAPKATAAVIRNQSADCSYDGTTCVSDIGEKMWSTSMMFVCRP